MRRVLVVDDDPLLVKLVQTALAAEGLEVIAASNGAEALLAVDSQHPDLIVLDVAMPVLDGFETLRALRAKPETASLPVIMLTARQSDADVVKGWSTGADLYITKPFEVQELVLATKRLLEVAEAEAGGE
jgi:two-component system alkaline phosphatase synthesis response regulator PhoP